jgi:Tol biopolymer transport system component
MVAEGNATGHTEIYTINIGGGGKTKVTNGGQPSYSPDGKKIAYTVYKGNATGGGIYTIKVGGGNKTKLIDNNAGEAGPSWGSRP